MLYHAEVHWPKRIRSKLPFGIRALSYSHHAKLACQNDRYGRIQPPASLNVDDAYVFEAEEIHKSNPLTKIVLRIQYNDSLDIVMACIPQNGGLFVKTLWFNERDDTHKTLDKSKYVK